MTDDVTGREPRAPLPKLIECVGIMSQGIVIGTVLVAIGGVDVFGLLMGATWGDAGAVAIFFMGYGALLWWTLD